MANCEKSIDFSDTDPWQVYKEVSGSKSGMHYLRVNGRKKWLCELLEQINRDKVKNGKPVIKRVKTKQLIKLTKRLLGYDTTSKKAAKIRKAKAGFRAELEERKTARQKAILGRDNRAALRRDDGNISNARILALQALARRLDRDAKRAVDSDVGAALMKEKEEAVKQLHIERDEVKKAKKEAKAAREDEKASAAAASRKISKVENDLAIEKLISGRKLNLKNLATEFNLTFVDKGGRKLIEQLLERKAPVVVQKYNAAIANIRKDDVEEVSVLDAKSSAPHIEEVPVSSLGRLPAAAAADSDDEGSGEVAPADGTNTTELDSVGGRLSGYIGAHPWDIAINKIREGIPANGCMILNSDDSSGPGMHWIGVWWHGDGNAPEIDYYDSLGRPPDVHTTGSVITALKDALKTPSNGAPIKLKINSHKDQSSTTKTCGEFALRFLIDRSRGKSFRVASGYNDSIAAGEAQAKRDGHRWNFI